MDQDLGSKISIMLFVSFQLSEFFLNFGCQEGLLDYFHFQRSAFTPEEKGKNLKKNKNRLVCSVV